MSFPASADPGAALGAASMALEARGGHGGEGAALSQSTKRAEAPCLCGEGALANQDAENQSAQSRRDWMGEVEVSARAYAKMCLHAARHPHAAINGLLLGLRGGPPECLFLTDCVPLFHSNLALSVMLEVALNQVDLWASRSNLLVAGYYQANARLDDMSPTPLALKMAGRLAEFFEGAVLIMLDNQKLTLNPCVPPIIVLEQRDRHWLPKDKNLVMWRNWESSRHICKSLLEAKAHTQLVDFDAHLDDIRQDWTNQHLNTEIARLVSVANGSA